MGAPENLGITTVFNEIRLFTNGTDILQVSRQTQGGSALRSATANSLRGSTGSSTNVMSFGDEGTDAAYLPNR